jgi:hypothetical protein
MISQIQSMTEGRHKLVWQLAKALATHFLTEPLVKLHLDRMAGGDSKLKKKGDDAIKSLRKYRYFSNAAEAA